MHTDRNAVAENVVKVRLNNYDFARLKDFAEKMKMQQAVAARHALINALDTEGVQYGITQLDEQLAARVLMKKVSSALLEIDGHLALSDSLVTEKRA